MDEIISYKMCAVKCAMQNCGITLSTFIVLNITLFENLFCLKIWNYSGTHRLHDREPSNNLAFHSSYPYPRLWYRKSKQLRKILPIIQEQTYLSQCKTSAVFATASFQ